MRVFSTPPPPPPPSPPLFFPLLLALAHAAQSVAERMFLSPPRGRVSAKQKKDTARGRGLGVEKIAAIELQEGLDPLGLEQRVAARDGEGVEDAHGPLGIVHQGVKERRVEAVLRSFRRVTRGYRELEKACIPFSMSNRDFEEN